MRDVIRVAGIEIERSALTRLALELRAAGEADLGWRIGQTIDSNAEELNIYPGDADILLAHLRDPPEELVELRDALRRNPL